MTVRAEESTDVGPSDDERVEIGIRRENFGLTSQRLDAIKERFPEHRLMPEFAGGIPVRMRMYEREGARV